MTELALVTVKTVSMSSREISELVESRHDNVKRSMETLRDKGVISFTQSEETSHGGSGSRPVEVYLVGKRDSYIIVAQLSPEFTARLVDRWQELEAAQALALPQTYHQALVALTEEVGKRLQLEAQAVIDAPKIAFAMAVRQMEGACKIGEFCKAIGIGRNLLFSSLRGDKILMEDNMPYQKYLDAGWFSVIEQIPFKDSNGKSHPAFTTLVTGKGQVALQRKYAQWGDQHGTC